jgi:hypothetical protein
MATTSVPSTPACELYVEMELRAKNEHLSIVNTLTLALDRLERGHRHDRLEVGELMQQGWIAGAADGGWTIHHQ